MSEADFEPELSLADRIRRFRRRRKELRSISVEATRRSLAELAELVSECDYPRVRQFHALQKPIELARFLERVRDLAVGSVLEIGTAAGGTLFLLCRVAAPKALIVSVDLPGGEFGGGYAPDLAHFYRRFARARQRVALIRGNSSDPRVIERVRAIFAKRGGVDLVLVDGDHSLAGVTADFEHYWPLVRPGGLMAFHDINPGQGPWGGEVPQFWARHRHRFRSEEFVQEPAGGGYGIGVLWKEPTPTAVTRPPRANGGYEGD